MKQLPDNARQGFFEWPDLAAVISHLPDCLHDFTRFAYLTGWRKGENRTCVQAQVWRQKCL